jgi:pimeloyl-ACP methyl ester carboxylesterase
MVLPCSVRAAEHKLPLDAGRVPAQRLLDTVGVDAGLPRAKAAVAGTVDLTGDNGATFVRQLQATLGKACQASIEGGVLAVNIDGKAARPDALTQARLRRLLTSGRATRPVVAGDRFGITLPEKFDPAKPLLLLVHGIDSDNGMWGSFCQTAGGDGVQSAYFRYDYNSPLVAAGDLLGDCLADLLLAHPDLKVNILGHSMGGLVARQYIEGPCYRGGIGRLFLVGTPNHGSEWASWRWALEVYQRCYEGKKDPDFAWTRLCKEGSGPAARDMLPTSAFLRELNSHGRRDGVQYTVIAGDRSSVKNVAAGVAEQAAGAVPTGVRNWWGIRQARAALETKAQTLRAGPCDCDGPVSIDSCRLEAVKDFVVLHADHMGLVCGYPPAAWATIKDRLTK